MTPHQTAPLTTIHSVTVHREFICKSRTFDNPATYITRKIFSEPWPLCNEHAAYALIAGADPVSITSQEGRHEAGKIP